MNTEANTLIESMRYALCDAVEREGFALAGPSDVRACENGEPARVCRMRQLISDASCVLHGWQKQETQAIAERDALARAAVEAITKTGGAEPGAPLTGPHILMMLNDLADHTNALAQRCERLESQVPAGADLNLILAGLRQLQLSGPSAQVTQTFEVGEDQLGQIDALCERLSLGQQGGLAMAQSYWQPHLDEMPQSLNSFEVYRNLDNGKRDYPEVTRWDEYRGDDIEGHVFVDANEP